MNDTTAFRRYVENRERNGRQGAGVIPLSTSTGKLLLCKRAKEQAHPGTWCGFGGMMIEGENPEEAALRELREEAGIPERKVVLLKSATYEAEGFPFHNFIGLVDLPESFAPSPGKEHRWEVASHAWVLPKDVRGLGDLHPGLEFVLRREASRLEGLDARRAGR